MLLGSDYQRAEEKIAAARRWGATELSLGNMGLSIVPSSLLTVTGLRSLDLWGNHLTVLPDWMGSLTQLERLDVSRNRLTVLPDWMGTLTRLARLDVSGNHLTELPDWIGALTWLQQLNLHENLLTVLPESLSVLTQLDSLKLRDNQLAVLPESLGALVQLRALYLSNNQLKDMPASLAQIEQLKNLDLDNNPLNPELAAAYQEGLGAVMRYLRAKAGVQVALNEAKLILIGEGEVGKSCLLGALRNDPWKEGLPTTHGIEIKTVKVTDPSGNKEITLNGWDFGGQRVYRPTHQLFFSAPAVYLVVWKPREGPRQGFVKEWIRLVKHREPDAKILVVATHGGPQERQPDIDRQEIWDSFGKDTIIDFFHVDSKPDSQGKRPGIDALKATIARVAANLPEMGRKVPERWKETRDALQHINAAYLSLDRVLNVCREHRMNDDEARLFITISHRLGHLIHYEHDVALRDIVVLKPDWLATAISFVLDDKQTRAAHGLVSFVRLGQLWNDPVRAQEFRYPSDLHPVFVRLMERFDLSYRVAGARDGELNTTSLIAQLVPDVRPEQELQHAWLPNVTDGDEQQAQICRIVDAQNGQSAAAEGLFYQLIVRLHKFSLGRVNYADSVHWQRGLVLDDDYNGRALLENIGNDVRITVRAPYPQAFLSVLTHEVKWLVENFWQGLRCDVMVPCLAPCGKNEPGIGSFEVEKLIAFKRQGLHMFPCLVSGCNQLQNIDSLLLNAPAARPQSADELFAGYADVKQELIIVRQLLAQHDDKTIGRFDQLDISTQRILSKVDDAFTGLMQALTDEAKDGPRLFSLVPINRKAFNPKRWTSEKFRLTLWCEHSRLPLPAINGKDSKAGVYEIELTRAWFKKAAPFLKVLTGTLSLVLPVASSTVKWALDDTAYKQIEEQLDFGQKSIEAVMEGGEKVSRWLGKGEASDLEHGAEIRAESSVLRELHALLKEKDPGFGGLVRVQNKRQEFLWVHERYASEY